MNNTPETLQDFILSFRAQKGVALISHNGYRTFTYSYEQLYVLIEQMAGWYTKNGIQKGDRVAIWGVNSPEWVVAELGALFVGAIVVPLDIQASPMTVEKIVERAGVSLIFQTQFRPKKMNISTVVLEELFFNLSPGVVGTISAVSQSETALIVYTSGTTGDPKGVVLTHKNITANVVSVSRQFSFPEKIRILSVLPLSHMFEQVGGLFVPLYLGGTVVYPRAIVASALFTALTRFRITHMVLVPRLLEAMHQGILARAKEEGKYDMLERLLARAEKWPQNVFYAWLKKMLFRKIHRAFGSSFEFAVSGGASLSPITERFWRSVGIVVYQGYGLTECSPVLTTTTKGNTPLGSVGKAIHGVELTLSKEWEILARGDNIFLEYYNDKEKTLDAMKDGWFLTGDKGEIDINGNLYIKGRIKEMIVTPSGMNVYPDDVENILLLDERVFEACVVGKKKEQGEMVYAVLILKKNEDSAKNSEDYDETKVGGDIVARANEQLGTHASIQGWCIWHEHEFPKTSTRKVKRILVQQTVERLEKEQYRETKETPKLYDIIGMVVGKNSQSIFPDSVLSHDLGLDSLGRVELISALAREYNYELPEAYITERTTVRDILAYIETRPRLAEQYKYPAWPQSFFGRVLRFIFSTLEGIISALFARITLLHKERLISLSGPVMFVVNHVSAGDHSIVVRTLPLRFRAHLSTPTADTYYIRPQAPLIERVRLRMLFFLSQITAGAFFLRQNDGFTSSLTHAGAVLDSGESLLMFPEGMRSRTEEFLSYQKGVAHLIRVLKVPVVPLAHSGLGYVFPKGKLLPKRGVVTVSIGKPIIFTTQNNEEIMRILEGNMRELHREAKERNPYRSLY